MYQNCERCERWCQSQSHSPRCETRASPARHLVLSLLASTATTVQVLKRERHLHHRRIRCSVYLLYWYNSTNAANTSVTFTTASLAARRFALASAIALATSAGGAGASSLATSSGGGWGAPAFFAGAGWSFLNCSSREASPVCLNVEVGGGGGTYVYCFLGGGVAFFGSVCFRAARA